MHQRTARVGDAHYVVQWLDGTHFIIGVADGHDGRTIGHHALEQCLVRQRRGGCVIDVDSHAPVLAARIVASVRLETHSSRGTTRASHRECVARAFLAVLVAIAMSNAVYAYESPATSEQVVAAF